MKKLDSFTFGAGKKPTKKVEAKQVQSPAGVVAKYHQCSCKEPHVVSAVPRNICCVCGGETDLPTTETKKPEAEQCSDPTLNIAGPSQDTPPKSKPITIPSPSSSSKGSSSPLSVPNPVSPNQPCSVPASILASAGASIAKISPLVAQLAKQSTDSSGAPHVQLKALAGTGKTTSCIEGLKDVKGITPSITPSPQQEAFWEQLGLGRSDKVRISAFNTTITDEMKARVESSGLDRLGVEARGVHSLGLQAVTKAFGRKEANKWAMLDLLSEKILKSSFRDLKTQAGMLALMNSVDDLVSLCKQTLTEPTYENLDQLASHYNVDVEGQSSKVYDLVPQVLELAKRPEGKIHFDDMIWLPLQLGLPIPKVDLQIIDEAQDLNRMQQELVYMAGHRVVFVGDSHQAIYGFAGADSESMGRMMTTLCNTTRNCVTLPLTVTRRCGKAIVREAQTIVPEFEAHESNPEGTVLEAQYPVQGKGHMRRDLDWNQSYSSKVKDGAMIVCRVNAPLVSQCFRFIRRKIPANILGRNIGQGLVKLVEKSKAKSTDQLRGWMENWLMEEQTKEQKKKYPSEDRMIALQDRHDCLLVFMDGNNKVEDVTKSINQVFTDSKNTKGIRLSSIHKSKGLEANQVFFLMPPGAGCPHPMAKTPWQQAQEMNLKYVAQTRAIHELTYVL